ncbi:nicotine blue oxidoreductase [Kribbella amoyensis]|uniref:Nicotine blue oxidoreductase n=1 Tax=Kribbella amoyensis TaxID=996641 RepID=A0A561BWS1_9ACTN|nr:nucleotidyltransferase family protein [Kribbella amoyensis]TWD83321.1 nicotine blue oxidoreductase [Kribbella amoyensis]
MGADVGKGSRAVAGLVLAAGAGRRMGGPKALVRDADGVAWVVRTVRAVLGGGCTPVLVVVGAEADRVRHELFGEPVEIVTAENWAEGMGASLRVGLEALEVYGRRRAGSVDPEAWPNPDGEEPRSVSEIAAVLVVPVDMPSLTAEVVHRIRAATDAPEPAAVLVRAVYGGVVGHPVVLGRGHWGGVVASAGGDSGAREYLRGRAVVEVECGDLVDGRDVDNPRELPPGHRVR